MPSDKAQYMGEKRWKNMPDFSEKLKSELRSIYTENRLDPPSASAQNQSSGDSAGHGFTGDADNFVEAVLAEARYAIREMREANFSVTKHEMVAELRDLRKSLKTASGLPGKLRTLSPEVDVLLGADADPLGLADHIDNLTEDQLDKYRVAVSDLLGRVIKAEQSVQMTVPDKKKLTGAIHSIAIEMAIRVLRVLNQYGIAASATAGKYLRVGDDYPRSAIDHGESIYVSSAVKILTLIGENIGMDLSEVTWRNIIISAKRKAPDIQ